MLAVHLARQFRHGSGILRQCACARTTSTSSSDTPKAPSNETMPYPPPKPPMNLMEALQLRIRTMGPMTISDYMREIATHPFKGYYAKETVFGEQGDFVTSTEVTQMFGESLGVWIVNEWMKMGEPMPLQIAELGPGRGTLMADIVKTLNQLVKPLAPQSSIHLVETAAQMREEERKLLCVDGADETKHGSKVFWHDNIHSVPEGFTFFIAHEFFDALPVNKFVKVDDTWHEILVDIDEEKDGLKLVKSKNPTPATKYIDPDETKTEVEISPQTGLIVQAMCDRIASRGGGALIVDYGHYGEKGDTLRGFKKHKLHDFLQDPGQADVTADVDFKYVESKCDKNKVLFYGPQTQEKFLLQLGMRTRLEMLKESATTHRDKANLSKAYGMLLHSDMGTRFKFCSIFPKTMQEIHAKHPVAGFS